MTGGSTQVLATQTASDGTHNAVLATQTGGNNVFFATESMLADSNMLQHAIGWAARAAGCPGAEAADGPSGIHLRRAQRHGSVAGDSRTSTAASTPSLLAILEKWKAEFNFVGSYYVNIGNDADRRPNHRLDEVSKPFYEQLLAMGNEIGTHSYTHPEDTNVLTPAQIQFEFEQSKLLLEQKLGITIEGAAVPGAPESLATSQLIGQYFSYMTGGYTGVGAGYPGAFGYITPGSDKRLSRAEHKVRLLAGRGAAEYGGGMNAAQAKAGMDQGIQRTLHEIRHACLRLAVARLRTNPMDGQRPTDISLYGGDVHRIPALCL